ncbi:hypothetical protein EON66_05155, partial [archaeon]
FLQALLYTGSALAYFTVNTMLRVVRPDFEGAAGPAHARGNTSQRNYFAIGMAVAQPLLMWWLGSPSEL